MTKRTREDVRAEEQARLEAYQDCFATPMGQRVLLDLQRRYLARVVSHDHAAANNGAGLAYIAGQRELILQIQAWVSCSIHEYLEARYPLQEDVTHERPSIARGIPDAGDRLGWAHVTDD